MKPTHRGKFTQYMHIDHRISLEENFLHVMEGFCIVAVLAGWSIMLLNKRMRNSVNYCSHWLVGYHSGWVPGLFTRACYTFKFTIFIGKSDYVVKTLGNSPYGTMNYECNIL